MDFEKNYSTLYAYEANQYLQEFGVNSTLRNATCQDIARYQQRQIFDDYSNDLANCTEGTINEMKVHSMFKTSEVN